ncbi:MULTISPECIES: TonB-dependent receptor [unclassified Sphingomonas]|uniref:TonB-dependent receptor n=1 Tax=unclassified Sphingomonas TaxID=196159 RepID=UPI00226A9BE8|nr:MULTISPECIES: TonB-dependent receptor [unclassified Sphingomonas]
MIRLSSRASTLALVACATSAAAHAQEAAPKPGDVLVIARRQAEAPAPTRASIDADMIAETVNATNVEDTLKYMPSLVVRKRHIGDTQAPLATRTSGLGSSARSLVYADGALLSALIGNNNGTASPRWGLVSPEEIARIDVLYGPFAAAYPGNAIGAVVNITTRLPDRLEGTLTAGTTVQTYDQYGTQATLPSGQIGATLGDRFGPLSLFASAVETTSNGQPLTYVTATRPAAAGSGGGATTGGYDAANRTGAAIRVLGASGIEHQQQGNFKLKAALDVTAKLRLTYVGGLFLNDTDATAETYLTGAASGLPVYAGSLTIAGYPYTVAASAFAGGVYRYDERHWSHALSARSTGQAFDWAVIGTLYEYAHDALRSPATTLPGASAGGAGTITRMEGTGWYTIDTNVTWRVGGGHVLSGGAHDDRFVVESDRYRTTDWLGGGEGPIDLASRGRTQTRALWAQDAWTLAPPLTLTLGGRYEWWRAYDGYNFALTPALAVVQPERRARGFSPKAALAYAIDPHWSVRASFGEAYRFPTVGELYQTVSTGAVLSVPDPNLRPERALSEELAIERVDAHGSARVSLFAETVADALISQSAPLVAGSGTLYAYVQNVDRTRARGVEVAFARTNWPLAGVDLSGSATYADAITRADAAFPAAVGHLLPSVPRWKASGVATWRPASAVSLTAAVRYASRNYGTLDNSDAIGNTYGGFYRYCVVDLRAVIRATARYSFALGVDNVGNDRYFLFHPFPQRAVSAQVTARL